MLLLVLQKLVAEQNNMRRLFAFGCSYTSYSWPTWADYAGIDFDVVQNWGMSGIGNRAIAERVAEANIKYQFTEDDVVIIQWSSHLRNDFWHQHSLPERHTGWKTAGSIFNYINEKLYDKKWINTFFFEPAYFMHTLNYISMTQGLLKSTGCKWYMTSIGDIRNMGSDLRDNDGIGEQTDFLKPQDRDQDMVAWKKIPELAVYNKPIWEDHADHWLTPMEVMAKETPELTLEFIDTVRKNKTFLDTHPSPRQHLLWVEKELKDKLQLSEESIKIANEVVDGIEETYQKFKFNKQTFELMMAKRVGFPPSAHVLKWPFRYEGF